MQMVLALKGVDRSVERHDVEHQFALLPATEGRTFAAILVEAKRSQPLRENRLFGIGRED